LYGAIPDPAREAYSAPQTPELDLRGLLLRKGEEPDKRRQRRYDRGGEGKR